MSLQVTQGLNPELTILDNSIPEVRDMEVVIQILAVIRTSKSLHFQSMQKNSLWRCTPGRGFDLN